MEIPFEKKPDHMEPYGVVHQIERDGKTVNEIVLFRQSGVGGIEFSIDIGITWKSVNLRNELR